MYTTCCVIARDDGSPLSVHYMDVTNLKDKKYAMQNACRYDFYMDDWIWCTLCRYLVHHKNTYEHNGIVCSCVLNKACNLLHLSNGTDDYVYPLSTMLQLLQQQHSLVVNKFLHTFVYVEDKPGIGLCMKRNGMCNLICYETFESVDVPHTEYVCDYVYKNKGCVIDYSMYSKIMRDYF